MPRSEAARGHRSSAVRATDPSKPAKKKITAQAAWREARALVMARKGRLALGLVLMLVNRLAGLVLPATSKYLIDDVIGKGHAQMLMPLALAAGAATIVQAVTSFALSQVLGVAAQRAITDMRRARRGARRAAAGPLLRLDAGRRADLAHHVRRRRHPQSRRHRPRAARRAASSRPSSRSAFSSI